METKYTAFEKYNEVTPGIVLPERASDRFLRYQQGKTRLDLISYHAYGDSSYGWLIQLANPELPSLEFLIPDETILRIPFPLDNALRDYNLSVQEHIKYYGNE